EAGYVSRVDQERDRRHLVLKLTPSGKILAAKSPLPFHEQIVRSASRMRAADRATFIALLDSFLEGMRE
ncbi:MAG: hypothetical protein JWO56_685, partial [Acidobacteria bacterium]|nr:hypothetical protein [Acidobacteriota bacterium]